MPLGPSPKPRTASVPRGRVSKPSRLGTHEAPPLMTLPATQEKTVPLGAAQIPQSGRNMHAAPAPRPCSSAAALRATNLETDVMPDPCPQFSPPWSPPQQQKIGLPCPQSLTLTLGLVFSFRPRGLAPKPPRLETKEPDPNTLPATQEEMVHFGAAQNPSAEETCMHPCGYPDHQRTC